MAELPPSPSYPNYANFLSNLIGGLPTDYRNAQEQQTRIDVSNAFKGGFPMNADGTPNWAAAMQQFGQAGGSREAADLGLLAQTQAYNQQGYVPLPGAADVGAPPAPYAAQPAPIQPPAAPPPQAPSGAIAGTVSDGSGPPPTLAKLASGSPLPAAIAPKVAEWLGKAMGVPPTAPLTPDQVAKAQSYLNNMLRAGGSLTSAMGVQQPQSGFAGRLNVPPDPAVAGARAVAAPVGTPQPAAARDIAAKETVAYGGPQRLPTQAEATAIATGNAPGTGGAPGTPFGLPPTAEAVWQRMVPQESGGKQFNPDGSVVTSPKGAVGIAQVMPETGPAAARLAGLPWDPARFKNDPNYNLALGRAYYAAQVGAFGSPDVAAAAYNAGPRAVLSAQAKATNRGGSYLDYLPAETKDYVAKVTGGGAPVAQGGAPQQGGQTIFPQPPRPSGFADDESAIRGYDQQIAHYASIPGNAGKGMADVLRDERDRFIISRQPREVRQGQSFVDAYGRTVYTAPLSNVNAIGMQRFLEEHPDATAEQIQAFQLSGRGARSGIAMYMSKYMQEHPDATDEDIKRAAQDFQSEGTAITRFTSGKQGDAINSYNTLVDHYGVLRDAIVALNNGDIRLFNQASQAWARQTGNPAPTNFDAVKVIVGGELVKAMTGSGGALADRAEVKADLDSAGSPKVLAGVIDKYRQLALGKLRSYSYQYKAATGRDDFDRLLAPGTKEFFLGDKGQGAQLRSSQGSEPGGTHQSAKVTTEDEYNALPKGTTYIHPDE
jgi:hypothetical protein